MSNLDVSHRNDSIASVFGIEIEKKKPTTDSFTVFWGQCMDDDTQLDKLRPALSKQTQKQQANDMLGKLSIHPVSHLTHCAIEFDRIR